VFLVVSLGVLLVVLLCFSDHYNFILLVILLIMNFTITESFVYTDASDLHYFPVQLMVISA